MDNGHILDEKIKLSSSLLLIIRLVSIAITFFLVPLLIDYLDRELYGVWITILSVTMWINYFDIGVGNGLRNKLTETLVEGNHELAKSLVSTAYVMLIFISISAFVMFLLISMLGNWSRVFNIEAAYNAELQLVMLVVVGSVIINFMLSLNNHVAYAKQNASFPALRELIFQLFLLIGVLSILTTSKHDGLFSLALIYMVSTVGSNIIATLYIFNKYRGLIPSLKYFSLKHVKPLMSLGGQFFLIQIAALIIFATDNMIITHVLMPSEVTNYNIIYRLFTPILFVHTILITPFWSAFTESYANGNREWIKSKLNKLNKYTLFLSFLIIILALFAKPIILLWLKDSSFYNPLLVVVMALYTFIMIWNNNYSYFLNGISKLRLQLYTAVIGGIINIPISIFLAQNVGLGSSGVALGSVISLSLFAIVGPLQSAHILKNMVEGD
jgi:O-antigen/teichoic acid export membrane protein